jgi:hypothetical protein
MDKGISLPPSHCVMLHKQDNGFSLPLFLREHFEHPSPRGNRSHSVSSRSVETNPADTLAVPECWAGSGGPSGSALHVGAELELLDVAYDEDTERWRGGA